MKKNVNKYRFTRTVLVWIICVLFMLTSLPTVSFVSGSTETPSSGTIDNLTLEDMTTQVQNLESLADYYKNETQYYRNVYENDSVNISNKYLIEINNNITTINHNIIQINQKIENIENILKIEIVLFGSLIAISSSLFIKIYKRKE